MRAADWPGRTFVLRGARLPEATLAAPLEAPATPDRCRIADVLVVDGAVADIGAKIDADVPSIACDNGQVWPSPVEMHTHLDKGHIWPRAPNREGNVPSAADAVRRDRQANWSAEDVERRFDFSLRCAYAHGTSAIRTHIDSYQPQGPISWPVFAKMRDRWSGRIALQGVALTLLDGWRGDEGEQLADLTARHGGVMGGATRVEGPPERQTEDRISEGLDRLFELAEARGLDVDLHVDETSDLRPNTLRLVAEATLRRRFRGRVVCGHCCSLALRPEDEMKETIALVRDAGLAIVSLPLVNLHLQGRGQGRTPRWRGVTPLRELDAAGVTVAISSDNTRDPFYAFGDLDPVEVYREGVRISHLDLEGMCWLKAITTTPADIMGRKDKGRIAVGAPADLILFSARSLGELLARPQSDRLVLRGGLPSLAQPPDYRELDALVGAP